jgi:uncharacterized protein YodC (DUF2158 family)
MDWATKEILMSVLHFPDGAMVVLNSGGPAMTVQNTRADDLVSCYWFDGAELRAEAFHHLAIKLADQPETAKDGKR